MTPSGTTKGLATSNGCAAVQRVDWLRRWPSEREGAAPYQTSMFRRTTTLPERSSACTSSLFSPRLSTTLVCHRASDATQSAAWPLTLTTTVRVAGA